MKTKQETFDMVVRGLAGQGWQQSVGLNADGVRQCLYRGPNGLKCAVGHLIPDELYRESFEGQHMAEYPSEANVVGLMACEGHHVGFLDDCQCTHDSHLSETPEAMRQHFMDLAEQHGLTWPEGC